jgi:serine protease AprX
MNLTAVFTLGMLLVSFAQAGELIRFTRAAVDPQSFEIKSTRPTHEVIVQFKNPVTEKVKQELISEGFSILGYLPDDAVVVQGDFSKIQFLDDINGAIPYSPEFKISKEIKSITTGRGTEAWVVTGFNKDLFKDTVKALKGQYKLLAVDSKSAVVSAPRSELLKIASAPGVEHVQPYPEFNLLYMDVLAETAPASDIEGTALDGSESGTKAMNFESVWSKGLTGRGQIAAFADTGLDSGNMSTISADFHGSVKAGQALGLFVKSWEDPFGHGTHVAGSIAGRGTASNGVVKGGAHEAMLVAQGMWSSVMDNLMPPSKLEVLFQNASKEGARIHSNSWGSPKSLGAYDSFAQQADEWIFNNPDVLVIFAAGNSGVDDNRDGRIDADSIGSPATAKNVLAVGASENVTSSGGIQVPVNKLRDPSHWSTEPIYSSKLSDNVNGLAMFSSRGPTDDGRIKPDVVAPGTNILSTRSHMPKSNDLWGRYDDNYVWSGGTSMAAPLAAGAATVARQILVDKYGQSNPSSALLKAFMHHTAVDMYPGQYGEVGAQKGQEILQRRPNSDEGFGRVDMDYMVKTAPALIVDERNGVQVGEEKVYKITVSANSKMLVNLVYNDAPASPNAGAALVNDLDLVLTKPDGSQVSATDRVNNHEIIEIAVASPGTYKLTVRGVKVPQGKMGKQPFAMLVSN